MDPELLKIAGQGKVNELHRLYKEKPESLDWSTPKGNTALHIASQRGHTDFVVAICKLRPLLLLRQNSRADTALHTAARAGHLPTVFNLIECAEKMGYRVKMLMTLNVEYNTALHEAARNNHHLVASLLIENEPQLAYAPNKAKLERPA